MNMISFFKYSLFFFIILLSVKSSSQDTLELNKIGFREIFRLVGNKYQPLKYSQNNLNEFTLDKSMRSKNIITVSVAEINGEKIMTNTKFQTKFIIMVQYEKYFDLFLCSDNILFKNPQKLYSSFYKNTYEDVNLTLITKDLNNIKIALNFYKSNDTINGNFKNKLNLMFFCQNIFYRNLEYSPDKFISVGILDDNFNGTVDINEDSFFCYKKDSTYFLVDGKGKSFTKISNKNYIVIENNYIYKVDFLQNYTNKLILKKTDSVDKSLGSKIVSPLLRAPINNYYESLDSKRIELKKLFVEKKYVYFNIVSRKCFNKSEDISSIDNINIIYEKFKDKINIVTLLNHKDSTEDFINIINYRKFNHSVGWSSDKLDFELMKNGYPFGVLFAPNYDYVGKVSINELMRFCNDTFSQ